MCECPCGDFEADFRLPGPEGTVYAIQRYMPCDNCGTEARVIVHRFSVAEAKNWAVDELPELPFLKGFDGEDFDGQPAALALLSPDILKRKLAAWAEENEDEEYDLADAMRAAVDEMLFDAIAETIERSAK